MTGATGTTGIAEMTGGVATHETAGEIETIGGIAAATGRALPLAGKGTFIALCQSLAHELQQLPVRPICAL